MQTTEQSLFSPLESISQHNVLTQKETVPQLPTEQLLPRQILQNALNGIFPQKEEESTVIKMRRILGESAKNFSDEQITTTAAEFQFLANSWLDEFEKEIFNGKTLQEILNEG